MIDRPIGPLPLDAPVPGSSFTDLLESMGAAPNKSLPPGTTVPVADRPRVARHESATVMSDAPWFTDAFDAPYLEVYAHRSQGEADAATENLLLPLGLRDRVVFDLACGAGRWLLPLSRAGARVIGADLSAALLQQAATLRAQHQASFTLLRSDMRALPLQTRSVDVVLSLFTSFAMVDARSGR